MRVATGLPSPPCNPRDPGTSPPRKGGVPSLREEKERVNRGSFPTGVDVCPVVWGVCTPESPVWPESSKREKPGSRRLLGSPSGQPGGLGRASRPGWEGGKLAGRAGCVSGDGPPRQSAHGLCCGGRHVPPAAGVGDQAPVPGQQQGSQPGRGSSLLLWKSLVRCRPVSSPLDVAGEPVVWRRGRARGGS